MVIPLNGLDEVSAAIGSLQVEVRRNSEVLRDVGRKFERDLSAIHSRIETVNQNVLVHAANPLAHEVPVVVSEGRNGGFRAKVARYRRDVLLGLIAALQAVVLGWMGIRGL